MRKNTFNERTLTHSSVALLFIPTHQTSELTPQHVFQLTSDHLVT